MKFDKKHKISEVAAREATRYAINSVLFERDDDGARLVATNGRCLAVVPVEDAEDDVPGPISQAALRESCKKRMKSSPDAVLAVDESVVKVIGAGSTSEHQRPLGDSGARFPDYRAVIPKAKNPVKVTLSARHLRELIDALGVMHDDVEGIVLTFDLTFDGKIDSGLPVRVDPVSDSNEAYGVIMPISE